MDGKRWLLALGALTAVFLPLAGLDQYFVHLLIMVCYNILMASGLNLVMGYGGAVSFAQGAFAAVGAYSSALFAINLGWSFWICLPAAAVVTGLLGFLLSIPTLRVRGHYLTITTMGFQFIIILTIGQWYSLTRGTFGITGIPGPEPFLGLFPIASETGFYYLFLSVAAVGVLLVNLFIRSRIGRELICTRENEVAARSVGIRTNWLRVIAFTLSAVMAGVAGSLFAHYVRNLHPAGFDVMTSATAVLMVLLGGQGTLWGPVAGALLLTLLPEYLRFLDQYYMLAFGIAMMLIVMAMPNGLAGLLQRLLHSTWLKGRGSLSTFLRQRG